MNTRKAIDGRAGALMVLLCAVWGLQQVAIKAAAPDVAPILQIAIRSGLAAIAVALLVWRRGEGAALGGGTWRPGLLVGALFALEYLFVGEGLRFTSASHMAIFLYTAPIFAALGLQWKLPSERLKPPQWAGIGVAFAGIVIAFAGRGGPAGGQAWIGDLMGIAAAMSWGATTLSIRFSRLSDAPATVTVLYQLVGACAILAVAALLLGQTGLAATPISLASLAFQTVVMSFLSLLLWFSLLRTYLASRLGVLSFMTPLFGIGFGVWLLDEELSAGFLIGALCVLAGILLVSGHEWIAGRRVRD